MMQSKENTNTGGWDSEREKALTAREKHLAEQEAAMIEKGLVEAFTRAGGRQSAKWDDPHEPSPFVAVKQLLKDKLAFTSSGIIIKDERHPNGKPKSLDDKLKELKSGSLSDFFNGTEPQQQQQPTAKPSYTREQARKGKADMKAIARGDEAVITNLLWLDAQAFKSVVHGLLADVVAGGQVSNGVGINFCVHVLWACPACLLDESIMPLDLSMSRAESVDLIRAY